MTALARTWGRLTLPGKVVFTLVPLLAVLTAGLIAVIVIFGGAFVGIVNANLGVVRFVGAATIILVITIPIAFLNIYLELKVIAAMNLRVGPDRVGPWGAAHPSSTA
jgi:NADH:ubiquinone oxidoreductase subunit H